MIAEPRPSRTRSNKDISISLNELVSEFDDLTNQVDLLSQQVVTIQTNPQVFPVPQAVNQVRNGSFSHSTGSWANSATADDRRYECYGFFSNAIVTPENNQPPMYPNTTITGAVTVTFVAADVNVGSNTITVTKPMPTGTSFRLTSTGTLPAPLATGTTYFAIGHSDTDIFVASSYANAYNVVPIDITDTGSGGATHTISFFTCLKEDSDTTYSTGFCDWDWPSGSARMMFSSDVSAPIPGLNIEPSYSYFLGLIAAFTNSYVIAPAAARMWAGLYAHSTAKAGWDWIYAPFEISAEVFNGADTSTTSRDYLVEAVTDRGFTISSDVLTVASAPSNANFTSGGRVVITWPEALNYGVISYDIYRNTGGTFLLLESVVTGQLTYIDNNSGDSVGSYPSSTFDELVAYTATIESALTSIPYAGDPLNPQWATLVLAPRTPQNYDKSDTILADGQWLRFGLSGVSNFDLQVTDGVVTSGDKTVDSALAQFTYLAVGCAITITPGNIDVPAHTSTVASLTSATSLEMADNCTFTDTDCTVYITGGAPPHSLYVDLVHLDFVAGAAFSPNPEDFDGTHGLPPVTPNGSTQGGSGTGGGGDDGGPVCVFEDELIETQEGIVPARIVYERFCNKQLVLFPDGYGSYNKVVKMSQGITDVWYLECKNGVSLRASDTKQVYVDTDTLRTVALLNKGDRVLTDTGEGLEHSEIVIKAKLKKGIVIQIGLEPGHSFLAGTKGFVLVNNAKPIFPIE